MHAEFSIQFRCGNPSTAHTRSPLQERIYWEGPGLQIRVAANVMAIMTHARIERRLKMAPSITLLPNWDSCVKSHDKSWHQGYNCI